MVQLQGIFCYLYHDQHHSELKVTVELRFAHTTAEPMTKTPLKTRIEPDLELLDRSGKRFETFLHSQVWAGRRFRFMKGQISVLSPTITSWNTWRRNFLFLVWGCRFPPGTGAAGGHRRGPKGSHWNSSTHLQVLHCK